METGVGFSEVTGGRASSFYDLYMGETPARSSDLRFSIFV